MYATLVFSKCEHRVSKMDFKRLDVFCLGGDVAPEWYVVNHYRYQRRWTIKSFISCVRVLRCNAVGRLRLESNDTFSYLM
jgi:hypothetical protein